ncbi:hypothetical protein HMPREF0539_0030, partial [Lacticaseibacillus rhamnosus LMS2-1]
MTIKQ